MQQDDPGIRHDVQDIREVNETNPFNLCREGDKTRSAKQEEQHEDTECKAEEESLLADER